MRPRIDQDRVTFRPLTTPDVATLAAWLADPDVYAWYREGEPTVDNLTRRFAPIINGTVDIRGWIVQINELDAGWVQCSEIDPTSDYARQLDLPEPYRSGAVGIDVLLGDAQFRNGGWGPVVLRAMLDKLVFSELGAPVAIIAPELMNERAIHAYERAGFRWLKTVPVVDQDPDSTPDEYCMIITDEYVMGLTSEEFRAVHDRV